jgi:hypothetical protein
VLLACVEEKLTRYKELYPVETPGISAQKNRCFQFLTQEHDYLSTYTSGLRCGTEGDRSIFICSRKEMSDRCGKE